MTPQPSSLPILSLRPYQQQALDSVSRHFFDVNQPSWRQLMVLPTGGGKTICFASLQRQLDGWLSAYPPVSQKVMVVAHREELLTQAADKIRWANPTLIVEIEQANNHASPMADVVIASVQTLAMGQGKRLRKFNPDDFRALVVDEAHHATAASYQTILRHFGFLPPVNYFKTNLKFETPTQALQFQRSKMAEWDNINRPDRLLLGVTATPKRGDNIGLEAVFQTVVFSRDILSMVKDKYLAPPRAYRIESDTSLEEVHKQAGDFNQAELGEVVDNKERNLLAVKAWGDYALDRPTIAFCVTVKHAYDLAEVFRRHGVAAEAIDGALDTDERARVLRDFKSGRLTVITNCNILTEGFDEPKVSCILHTRPTQSALLYQQMTGRGLRLSPETGKKDCVIIDVVDVTTRHRLSTAADLVGLPVNFDAKGEDLESLLMQVNKLQAANPLLVLDGVRTIDELGMRAQEVDLFAAFEAPELTGARLSWMRLSEEHYQVSFPWEKREETVTVRQNALGLWQSNLTAYGSSSPLLGAEPTLQDALRECENWIAKNRQTVTSLLAKGASWMTADVPATPPQLNYLARLGAGLSTEAAMRLTKGQAHHMIEMLKAKAKAKAQPTTWRRR